MSVCTRARARAHGDLGTHAYRGKRKGAGKPYAPHASLGHYPCYHTLIECVLLLRLTRRRHLLPHSLLPYIPVPTNQHPTTPYAPSRPPAVLCRADLRGAVVCVCVCVCVTPTSGRSMPCCSVYVCVYVCMHACVCVHACMCACMHVCVHACVCVCVCVCVCMCMHVDIASVMRMCVYVSVVVISDCSDR